MSVANLIAYTRWHVRDAAVRAAAAPMLVLVLAGIPIWSLARNTGLEAIRAAGRTHDEVAMIYQNVLTLAMTLGALLVASGFVAMDREKGHVRFLFSTPVVAWQFYLQRYLVGLVAFVGGYALVPVLFSWIVFPVGIVPVIASATLYALLIGSLAMLAGAITRRDGLVVIVVTLFGSLLQSIARNAPAQLPDWMRWVAGSLPPIDTADQIRGAWLAGRAFDHGDLTFVVGYAVAMLVTALFTIHRTSLVR